MSSSRDPDASLARPPQGPPLRLGRDLTATARHTHDVSGAVLTLARRRGGGYVVAWIAPWQKTIDAYHPCDSQKEARRIFTLMTAMDPPVTPRLCRDWQAGKVYKWEGLTLDDKSPPMTPEQMQNVVRRIAADFNLAAQPSLKYKKPHPGKGYSSYFYPDKNHIQMKHKELSAVIHEIAHAIDMQNNGNKWGGHGPSFVRTLITLAARYQYWHAPEALEEKARSMGIAIAPPHVVRTAPPGPAISP